MGKKPKGLKKPKFHGYDAVWNEDQHKWQLVARWSVASFERDKLVVDLLASLTAKQRKAYVDGLSQKEKKHLVVVLGRIKMGKK